MIHTLVEKSIKKPTPINVASVEYCNCERLKIKRLITKRWWSMSQLEKLPVEKERKKKPVELQKESPAGCAGEDKQSKGN